MNLIDIELNAPLPKELRHKYEKDNVSSRTKELNILIAKGSKILHDRFVDIVNSKTFIEKKLNSEECFQVFIKTLVAHNISSIHGMSSQFSVQAPDGQKASEKETMDLVFGKFIHELIECKLRLDGKSLEEFNREMIEGLKNNGFK